MMKDPTPQNSLLPSSCQMQGDNHICIHRQSFTNRFDIRLLKKILMSKCIRVINSSWAFQTSICRPQIEPQRVFLTDWQYYCGVGPQLIQFHMRTLLSPSVLFSTRAPRVADKGERGERFMGPSLQRGPWMPPLLMVILNINIITKLHFLTKILTVTY